VATLVALAIYTVQLVFFLVDLVAAAIDFLSEDGHGWLVTRYLASDLGLLVSVAAAMSLILLRRNNFSILVIVFWNLLAIIRIDVNGFDLQRRLDYLPSLVSGLTESLARADYLQVVCYTGQLLVPITTVVFAVGYLFWRKATRTQQALETRESQS
jgi:energy-converting hydrogenase Eha subunit C